MDDDFLFDGENFISCCFMYIPPSRREEMSHSLGGKMKIPCDLYNDGLLSSTLCLSLSLPILPLICTHCHHYRDALEQHVSRFSMCCWEPHSATLSRWHYRSMSPDSGNSSSSARRLICEFCLLLNNGKWGL
jgi:hypothetical protein